MSDDADVYQGDRLAGYLERTPTGTAFRFANEFLTDTPAFPGFLSRNIPYQQESISAEGDNLPPFFINLLPEGARLQRLAAGRVAKDDFLGMLIKVGWDAIGDVAVVPHGTELQPKVEPDSHAPEEISFWDIFETSTGEERFDSAIPGVQAKISSDTISFPARLTKWPASILKLSPRKYPLLVQNEAFFLRMAAGCGIRVNKAMLVQDRNGEFGLLVQRFDRVRTQRRIHKLHQEDACQLLNFTPANKYDVSFRQAVEAVRGSVTAPIPATLQLLQLYAFSYLIGNHDLHGKNVSVLWKDGIAFVSPGYDLLSTLPYRQLEQKMAMPLDGRNANFRAGHIIEFGKRYQVPERATKAMLFKLIQATKAWISKVEEIGFEPSTIWALQKEIDKRCDELLPS